MNTKELSGKTGTLEDNVLFQGLDEEAIAIARHYFTEQALAEHEVIVSEGELGDEMFVVTGGSAAVKVGGRKVAEIPSDEVFGEVCLLEPGMRSATVIAKEALSVLTIDTATFNRLCGDHPAVALRITLNLLRPLGERLRRANELLRLEHEALEDLDDDLNKAEREPMLQRLLRVLTPGH
jgi:CRP/FNR family transcriptional regulator, cyclic AMP receptor protein